MFFIKGLVRVIIIRIGDWNINNITYADDIILIVDCHEKWTKKDFYKRRISLAQITFNKLKQTSFTIVSEAR